MSYKVLHDAYVDTYDPKTYFEKFYTAVREKANIPTYGLMGYSDRIERAIKAELFEYNVSIKLTKNRRKYLLRFPDEKAHLMFVLQWS